MSPYFKLLRPHQWLKNIFVLIPMIFGRVFWNPEVFWNSILAVLSFILISSSVYVLNDLVDAESDRKHPVKKKRPIAAKQVSEEEAIGMWVVLLLSGFALSYSISIEFFIVVLGYIAMTMAYSIFLKRVIFLDILLIALGFVFRVLGGGMAAGVVVTDWMIVLVFLFTLFLALSKRRQELKNLKRKVKKTREVLNLYTIELIDQISAIIVPIAITSYIFYTFDKRPDNPYFILTIPIILYSFFQYLYLLKSSSFGESSKDYLTDWKLIFAGALWFMLVMVGLGM
ncbi:MAG: decaprenyl-phosphate phosphoribosyltransferase [Candidatus Gracilibacteria bacterium]|nr:decaprenyl-phosphate phosphoribosyltransferase [Candidatus Gracilibacteria bacterium]